PLLNELIQSSLALYEEFASASWPEFHFQHKGSLAIYKSSAGLEAGVKAAELVKPYWIESKALDPAAARELEPRIQPDIVGGIYFNGDAHLNPAEFVRWLASMCQAKGVTFLPSAEVLCLETAGNRISAVRTTRGDFLPDQVVLAAGSWSAGLAAQMHLALPIQPAKGYSITVKSQERDESIPIWLSESKVVVTPMGGILRFAGTLELDELNFSIDQRRVNAIRRAAREYLAGTDEYEVLEIWRGLRPLTPDSLPIIEVSETWRNLIIATGHGMQGISLGPITGKLAAQLICKETPSVDVAALSGQRFR
ncbi:MAG: NAD(P)/FAD-dependent oxidoreductase, partial [Terriglobia bacterium]